MERGIVLPGAAGGRQSGGLCGSTTARDGLGGGQLCRRPSSAPPLSTIARMREVG